MRSFKKTEAISKKINKIETKKVWLAPSLFLFSGSMNLSAVQSSEIKNLDLLAKQVVEGFITGMHKSPFHGFSVEFSEHKLYNKGGKHTSY